MLICEKPGPGRPGGFLFTFTPGAVISQGIAAESGGPIAHVAFIVGPDEVVEALAEGFVFQPLKPRLDPANRQVQAFIRRPRGLTPAAVAAMIELVQAWEGTPYDLGSFWGFVLSDPEARGLDPNWAQDPDELFCSEACATLLIEVEALLSEPLPPKFKERHPSWMTPWDLFSWPGLWEPVCCCEAAA